MKKLLVTMMTLMVVWTTVGCGDNTVGTGAETETTTATDTVAQSEAEDNEAGTKATEAVTEEAYYPVTITNYNKSKEAIDITFEKRPERVVAVYQNSIETLLALGVEETIIAATGLDHAIKPAFKEGFDSLNYYENGLSKEEVMGLNPDFILSWSSLFGEKNLGDVPFWHERNIKTYMMTNSGAVSGHRTLENEYTDIRNLGIIFNARDKAEAIIGDIQGEVARGKAFAAEREPVKAVVIEANPDGTFRVYGENSVGGDMATQVGAELVAKESGTIGAEDLIAMNPEVIFTVYYAYFGGSVEEEEALARVVDVEGLSSVSAIVNDRVHPMMLGEVYCSGVRTMDGVKTMLRGLYPDAYEE